MMTDRFLNRRNVLTLAIVSFFLHAMMSVLHWMIGLTWLDTVDQVLLGLTAFCTILYAAKSGISIRLQPAQTLLVLFMVWHIISCVSMTIKYGSDWVSYNRTEIFCAAVCLLMAFPLGYVWIRDREGEPPHRNRTMMILLHGVTVCWSLFMLIVLIHVFQGKTIAAPVDGGVIGLKGGSLVMNCHYNINGPWELLFFMICCFMVYRNKHIAVRAVYGVFTVIHYLALTLSNSRTCFLTGVAAVMAFTGIALYCRMKKGKESRKILIAVAAGVAAGALFYLLRPLVFKLTTVLPAEGGAVGKSREMFSKDVVSFNSRTRLWGWSLEGIVSSFRAFMFGMTPKSVPEMIRQMSNGAFPNSYSHNQFVEIAAAIGVPGLCLFLGWLYLILKDIWVLFFVRKERNAFLFVPVMAMAMLLANMMEAHLLFYDHLSGYAFFLLTGLIHGYVNQPVGEKYALSSIFRKVIPSKAGRK